MSRTTAAAEEQTLPTTEQAPDLYYTALARIRTGGKVKYSLVTTKLSKDESSRSSTDEDSLKKDLDTGLRLALTKLEDENTLSFNDDVKKKDFDNPPIHEFKFAEKFTTGILEDTDVLASTPHRTMQFFSAEFIPGTIYAFLFTGLVIGAALVNTVRLIVGILNLRHNPSVTNTLSVAANGERVSESILGGIRRLLAPSKKTTPGKPDVSGIEICNSTICLGNPIPVKKITTLEKIGAWADAAFKFAFTASFYYWVLWSIASAIYGIAATAIPFSLPIAIAIPIVCTLIQVFGDSVINYVWGEKIKSSPEDHLSFDTVAKLKLLDKAAGTEDKESLKAHLQKIYETVARNKTQRKKSKSIIEKPSLTTQRLRLLNNVLIGFGTGFIMTTLLFFAASSFIGTGLVSVLLPFIASAVMGAVYAIKAYRDSTHQSSLHESGFKQLEKDYDNFKVGEEEKLVDTLNDFYQIVLNLRQQAKDKSLRPFAAAIDNPDFLYKNRVSPKGWNSLRSRTWRGFKKIVHRFVIFIGGTESGSLLFRAVFGLVGGLAALGLAANPLSMTAIGIIMLFIGVGWGISKLCQFSAEKYIKQEKLFLDQSEIFIRSLSREHAYLSAQLKSFEDPSSANKANEEDEAGEGDHLLNAPSDTSTAISVPPPASPINPPSPSLIARETPPAHLSSAVDRVASLPPSPSAEANSFKPINPTRLGSSTEKLPDHSHIPNPSIEALATRTPSPASHCNSTSLRPNEAFSNEAFSNEAFPNEAIPEEDIDRDDEEGGGEEEPLIRPGEKH